METVSLKDLSPQKRVRYVAVKLIQIWENWSQAKEMYEVGLLFLDYQGNTIEGCIGKDRVAMFKKQLKEDKIYKIEQFMVVGQKTRLKIVDHPYRIRLAKYTKIIEICPQPQDFPFYTYNIKSFSELDGHIGKNAYVSDVIGVAVQQTDIIPSKNNSDPRRQIRIKNNSGRVAIVTLWGKHAEQFEAEILYQKSVEANMIILFTGMTVSHFSGLLAFLSTSITRWHFNPPIPETEDLQNCFQNQHCLVEWDGHTGTTTEATETTLAALGQQHLPDIVGNKFKLNIIITEVNQPHDWWFYSCKNCFCGMKMQDGKRQCRKCSGSECTQRYKLSVNGIDAEAPTETEIIKGKFMFYGETAGAVISKDIALLLAQANGRRDFIPPAITNTVGKKYNVTAEVRQDTYDVEEEGLIMFEVKKAEIINEASIAETSSSQSTTHELPLISTPIEAITDQMGSQTNEEPNVQPKNNKRKSQPAPPTQKKTTRNERNKEDQAKRQLDFTSTNE